MLLNIFGTKISEAQCNDTLVKQAILESGHDAFFLKEYKVKFKKGKVNRPVRVAKYSAFLKDSTTYRFNVLNAKEFDGQVILQLYNRGKLLGSTYDFTSLIYNKSFDFTCNKTDSYQVLMSFIEGKAGCAVGVLSMVVNDSTIIQETEFPEALYVGEENPLYIAYTDEPGCSIHVFADQGTIEGQAGKYTIIPDTTGSLKITAQTIDKSGNIKEEISKSFEVIKLPAPYVSINGNTGGLISIFDLQRIKTLRLHVSHSHNPNQYKVINFTVSNKLLGINGKTNEGNTLNYSQVKFIEDLKEGDHLFITDIKVENPKGETINIKPVGFIIY